VKGLVEKNESEKETALRELKEETGITVAELIGDFREKINYVYRMGGKTIYKEVTYFLAEVHNGKVELSHEHDGYEWLSYEKASKRIPFTNARGVLTKANRFLNQPENNVKPS
jgi:8-oxo-dGTP pyrophosphatase MutT (NUDIX family)